MSNHSIDGFEKLEKIERLIRDDDSEFVMINREEAKFYYDVFLNTLMTLGRMGDQGFKLVQENQELKWKLREFENKDLT